MESAPPTKTCVLIAEDEAAIRRLLSETLTEAGFEVLSASNGEAALRKARTHAGPIDLLITDVAMPKLDGFDLRERILQERPSIKVLVISGALESNIEGSDFHLLRKPFLPSDVVAKARQIIGVSAGA